MKIIGVTGGIGSGKSTVCKEFAALGAAVIDADGISHSVTRKGEKAYFEIIENFGNGILTSDKEIDRRLLGKIVFCDKEKLKLLNKITHKYIFEEMNRLIKENSEKAVVVLDVPLLFGSDFPIKYDLSLGVIAPDDVRAARVMARDGISKEDISARIENQLKNEDYLRLCDVCVENVDIKKMKRQIADIFEGLRD